MSMTLPQKQSQVDRLLEEIADYVMEPLQFSQEALQTAGLCLADALGCAILATQHSDCCKLLGPVVPGTIVPNGSHVPGTGYILDPIKAAFDIGSMIRWLDYNDTWLAQEWGHPSDNLGGILAVADYLSRKEQSMQQSTLCMQHVLDAMIKAYEIQGVLAISNSFNRRGFDHVILVKVATAAVVAQLLGANREQVMDVLSQAWIDTGPLRTYRHAPNTGSRKSWAAGDATSRGVQLAMLTLKGEMGYPTALTTPIWGFEHIILGGKPLTLTQPLGCYVMEHILFKVSFPAEFHAQTAVECAFKLHPYVIDRLDEIEEILIETQEPAIRIIDKRGPLNNYADRDHCLQYMVAVGLLKGSLEAEDYDDAIGNNPQIHDLRDKMRVVEHAAFTQDYLDPTKRSIGNAITIRFKDGSATERVEVEYPLGHRRRRREAIPLIFQKLQSNLQTLFSKERTEALMQLFKDHQRLGELPVYAFMDLFDKAQDR